LEAYRKCEAALTIADFDKIEKDLDKIKEKQMDMNENRLANQHPIKFSCKDYGFECDFKTDEKNASGIIEKFGRHCTEKHGIEYSKGTLMQMILRKS